MKRSRFEARSATWLRNTHGVRLAPDDDAPTRRDDVILRRRVGEIDRSETTLDWFTAGLALLAVAAVLCLLSTRPGVPAHVEASLPWLAAGALVTGLGILARVNRRKPPRTTVTIYLVAAAKASPRLLAATLARISRDERLGELWLVADTRWPGEVISAFAESRLRWFEARADTFVERRVGE